MKKLAAVLLLAAAAVAAAAVLGADALVDSASRAAASRLAARAESRGVGDPLIRFQSADFLPPARIVWRGVHASGILPGGSSPFKGPFTFALTEVSLSLESLLKGEFTLHAGGIDLQGGEGVSEGGAAKRLKGEQAKVSFQASPFALREALDRLSEEFAQLVTEGSCSLPVFFDGEATFPVKGEDYTAVIRVLSDGGRSVFVMDEKDILTLSEKLGFTMPVTPSEIVLLSRNPLRAFRLLEIRDYARRVSSAAHGSDRSVPEDAYRHVLWSFVLTREYGPSFASLVTEAHEKGRTGNTEEEKRMDLINNGIGERYALADYDEDMVLGLVMTDPAVVRKPGQVTAGEPPRR